MIKAVQLIFSQDQRSGAPMISFHNVQNVRELLDLTLCFLMRGMKKSIIEKIQLSLFSSNVKSVGLDDVVDVSYRQTGILEQIFNFGTVQVGTKDDELPYVFHTVSNPKSQASALKNAVECFKNGRPVDINNGV